VPPVSFRDGTDAVVLDRHFELAVSVAQVDSRTRCLRMPERVREPFLHDPVGGEVDARRELGALSAQPQLDVETGAAHIVDKALDLAESRLRR
jgi:hypothetical protein